MSMKMMNAAYLVDNVALLSLQEKQDGVEFHCFDMDSKVQIAEGHIGWDVLDKQPFSTLEESARMAALQKIPMQKSADGNLCWVNSRRCWSRCAAAERFFGR